MEMSLVSVCVCVCVCMCVCVYVMCCIVRSLVYMHVSVAMMYMRVWIKISYNFYTCSIAHTKLAFSLSIRKTNKFYNFYLHGYWG